MVNKFKIARIIAGRKQVELSKKIGIPARVLSEIENGWRIPNPRQLKKLQEELPELAQVNGILER